jgi:hypothetical protein
LGLLATEGVADGAAPVTAGHKLRVLSSAVQSAD